MASKADRFGFYLRGRTWYTHDPVTRRDVSTRCADLGAAKLWRAARERLAADPAAQAARLATLGDECRLMLDALAAVGRSTGDYECRLGHWTRILGNDCPLAEVGPEAFDRYIAARRLEVTNHTISKELKCMLKTLRQAKRAGRWAGDLTTLRPLGFSAGYVPRTRVLTVAEFRALVAQLPPQGQAFVLLCVTLGLRRGEVLAMRPKDVDLETWTVRVRGTKTKGAARVLPVLEPFRSLVAAAAAELPLTKFATSGHYTTRLEVACRRAGIERCTPNDFRRTHATWLRTGGVDASTARALLGHTKGSQLLEQVYDQPRPHELAARAGKLEALTQALVPIAESLQVAQDTPVSSAEIADGIGHSGRSITPQPREDKHLGDPGTPETGLEPGGATAESLQPSVELPALEALELAAAALRLKHRTRVHWGVLQPPPGKGKRDVG